MTELEKDGLRYRWLKKDHEMVWEDVFGMKGVIKWVRYIEMPPPDISKEGLTAISVMDDLDTAIDRAIAHENDPKRACE